MTPAQQRTIIAAVASGLAWPAAAIKAGVNLEQLHKIVKHAQQGGCPVKLHFSIRLREAGRQATENSLKYHKGVPNHA